MTICIKLNGNKCAESYCDFWHLEKKKCSLAVESELRAEILQVIADKVEALIEKAENIEELSKIMDKLNVVKGNIKFMH
jgi:hypothetical protein